MKALLFCANGDGNPVCPLTKESSGLSNVRSDDLLGGTDKGEKCPKCHEILDRQYFNGSHEETYTQAYCRKCHSGYGCVEFA